MCPDEPTTEAPKTEPPTTEQGPVEQLPSDGDDVVDGLEEEKPNES